MTCEAQEKVGVALSGGGHRATVWGLGVLLGVVEARLNERVVSISSVSGGSIANGIVAHRVDFAKVKTEEFRDAIRPGLRHVAHDGLIFFGKPTNFYVALVLGLAIATAVCFTADLVLILRAVWGRGCQPAAVFWISAIGCLLLATLILLFGRRSKVVDRALARVHFSDASGKPVLLADVHRSIHHVFCATELQAGDHCYFTPQLVYSYRIGAGRPDQLPLSTAVQCSACYPVGFPPRTLAAGPFAFKHPVRDTEPIRPPARIVLADGGVYDNMADQWEKGFSNRAKILSDLQKVQAPADFLIVANASAGWMWKPLGRLGVVKRELVGLLRTIGIMYDKTTSQRRLELVQQFIRSRQVGNGLRGVLVAIEQSPFRVPREFCADSDPELAKRASEAIEFLTRNPIDPNLPAEEGWKARTEANCRVPTVLRALGQKVTVDIMEHACTLVMINLYVLYGLGTLRTVDRAHLEELCRQSVDQARRPS